MDKTMIHHASTAVLFLLLLPHGCSGPEAMKAMPLKHKATGQLPQTIALYEAWFGHPNHISVGYSSQDPSVIKRQIRQAKAMGISAFLVDWYGDREPFIDRSYALMQTIAAEKKFNVSMMYDETQTEEQNGESTDEALAAFDKFEET